MGLEWEQVVVDAADPVALGAWWASALGWVVVNDDPEELEIRAAPDRLPGLLFARVPESTQSQMRVSDGVRVKRNRLHIDLRPDDQDAEVARLEDLGARRIDIGQGDVTWVVMEDPEANEFCVLQTRALVAPGGHAL
jgi:Glyoxalase-like domain